jgi:putative nucleotidyltransferase with HDIG domain
MLVRMVHSAETAALFAVIASLVAGFQVHGDLGFAAYSLAGSLTAAVGAARVTQRGTLLRAGLRVGLANAVVVVALLLLGNHFSLAAGAVALSLAVLSGALCGVLVSGLAPFVESVFSYTTDVKLLELANREQSLLRELELRAPGTYHHSMMVGHLAEKAADAIGANALLAKVAGYYHDIGKMRRPQFFVENATITQGENRHEKLSPSMSARIIQAHVKDGVELAEKHKLALPILKGIAEHHGTSVIRYFYEKAKELADPEKGDMVAEHDYRYPGPKPQTREAGILMLADSVEAASRTLFDTSPARVQQLVQRIINNYFRDGQLDECSLTLRDLHAIAKTFIDTLSAIRHERIDYPEATDAAGRRMEEGDEGLPERDTRSGGRPEGARDKREDDLKRLGLD